MNCEGGRWRDEKFWRQFFTKYKVNMMNYIACIYHIDHQMDNALFILEHLLEQLTSSKVRLADRYKSSVTVISNLAIYYGENKQYDKCFSMCKMGMNLCLESGRGVKMGIFLGNQAEAMNNKKGKATETSKNLLKKAFYISDLMYNHSLAASIEKYYRSLYESDIIWY